MKNLLTTLSITLMSLTLFGQTNFEKRIIEEINIHRASMSLAPATFDYAAYKIAKEQLEYMVKTNNLPPIKIVGEDGKIVVKKLRDQMVENNFTGSGGCVSQTDYISKNGVIRGIHYSLAPEGQAKWVTCTTGRILDVIVDIRPKSQTYKRVEYVELDSTSGQATFLTTGLGHGFISLEDNSVVTYLLSSPYSPEFEFEIQPTGSDLNINWKVDSILESSYLLSAKDLKAPTLAERLTDGKLPK